MSQKTELSPSPDESPNETDQHGVPTIRHWVYTTLAIILATTLIRLGLNFRHTLAPGMDAAFYPLQTRWLIEHGELMFIQPPLIFQLNAALARAIAALTNIDLDSAIRLAPRIIDGVAHPWVVLPVMLLGYRWSERRLGSLLISGAAAVGAVMSPPVMRMASDFQKNSLGLVWMAFALWATREALASRQRWRWIPVLAFVALAAITHIGAFGVMFFVVAGSVAGYMILNNAVRLSRGTMLVLFASAVSIIGILTAVSYFEPAWGRQLINLPSRAAGMLDFRVHPGMFLLTLIVYGILGVITRYILRKRELLQTCDAAVAIGCITGLAVLFFPFLDGTWSMRFQLMSPLLIATLLLYSSLQIVDFESFPALPKCVAGLSGFLALTAPLFMQGPVVSSAAADELKEFGARMLDREATLVVAPHGVEFWAGLMMNTRVKSGSVPANTEGLDQVLIVEPKAESAGHRMPEPRERDFGPPDRRPGPPRREEPRRSPSPQHELIIPSNADLIHDGRYFRFLEVPVD